MSGKDALSKIILIWFLFFELSVLMFTEVYKYTQTYTVGSLRGFLSIFAKNFDFLYTGNLFWLTVSLISIVCIINMIIHISKISKSSINILLVISLISVVLLLIAVIIPAGEPSDISLISLSAKGTKTLLLSVFALTLIFFTVSLCVVSFSALMKYYLFRSMWLTLLVIAAGYLVVFLFAYHYKDDYMLLIENKKHVEA